MGSWLQVVTLCFEHAEHLRTITWEGIIINSRLLAVFQRVFY